MRAIHDAEYGYRDMSWIQLAVGELDGAQMARAWREKRQRGFTLVEVLTVMAILFIVGAFAVLGYSTVNRYLRIAGDLRDLNGTVTQAKLGAAADFTHARAYADLQANTFHLEAWNKAGNCWQTVGDAANPCTVAASPVLSLSSGVTFGFAGVGAPPPNTQQAGIAQARSCSTGTPGTPGGAGAVIANTACIVFNSRGRPIDDVGNPTGNSALYLTDGNMVYGLTVSATGLARNWSTSTNANNIGWQPR